VTRAIIAGAPEAWRPAIAALYLAAFDRKLGPLFGAGRAGLDLLAACLDLSRCLVATEEGRLAGVAGFCLDGRRFVGSPGWRPGRGLGLVLHALLRRRETPGTLLMDGIAVAPAWRGQGIGSRLIAAVQALAARHGRSWVRLDVVDSNPAARRLYLRLGFEPVAEQSLGRLGRALLGFGRVTTLRIAAAPPGLLAPPGAAPTCPA